MSLPLVSPPQLIAPDDVFGVALANRQINTHNDLARWVGVEHTVGASGAGEHHSVQIVKAVCTYIPPLYRAAPNNNPLRSDVEFVGPCVGFTQPPSWDRWTVAGADVYVLEFVTDGELIGFSHHACMDAAPTYTADQLQAVKARCELIDLTQNHQMRIIGGRVLLGSRAAIDKLKRGTIVAHVAVRGSR